MPTFSYKYTKTISLSIFNHIKTVSGFEQDRFMANGYACDCQSCPFNTDYHGHIITGNLEKKKVTFLQYLING